MGRVGPATTSSSGSLGSSGPSGSSSWEPGASSLLQAAGGLGVPSLDGNKEAHVLQPAETGLQWHPIRGQRAVMGTRRQPQQFPFLGLNAPSVLLPLLSCLQQRADAPSHVEADADWAQEVCLQRVPYRLATEHGAANFPRAHCAGSPRQTAPARVCTSAGRREAGVGHLPRPAHYGPHKGAIPPEMGCHWVGGAAGQRLGERATGQAQHSP